MKIKNLKLHKRLIAVTLVVMICLCSASFVLAASDIEDEIIEFVNQERKEAGLNELVENKFLNEAAKLKAQDMIGNNYFAHTSPAGIDPWFWFDKAGYQYKYAGENLAMDFTSASSAHRAWMKSQTHKDNIISSKFEEIGVAVMEGIVEKKETKVAVQLFGTPLGSQKLAMSLINQSEEETTKGEADENNQEEATENTEELLAVKIVEASVSPWQGSRKDEILVYAEIEGEPEKVEANVGKQTFELEKLRDNIYMNLILLENFDPEEQKVAVKATLSEDKFVFYQIPDYYFDEYIAKKEQEERDKYAVASYQPSDSGNKWQGFVQHNWVFLAIMIVFALTVTNIWVLEKEEERILRIARAQ